MKITGLFTTFTELKNNKQFFDEDLKFNSTQIFFLHVLFIIFYVLFNALSATIYHIEANPDIHNINPWLSEYLKDNDGIELYVLTLAMPAYLLLGLFIVEKINFRLKYLSIIGIRLFYFLLVCLFFSSAFLKATHHLKIDIDNILIVFLLVSAISISIIKLSKRSLPFWSKLLLLFSFLIFLFLLGLLINSPPSIFDYSYYIGPANKIIDGEKLGTFYMQYNVFGTYLFVLMQKFDLRVHEMFVVLILIFSLWIFLYRKTALLLFQNKTYVFLFLFTLIIIRCVAISGGPVSIPQVSAIRMDLWVPVLLVLLIYGFESSVTASAFSICYLLDDVFGFMYLTLYVLMLFMLFIKRGAGSFHFRQLLILLPIILSFIIHFLVFGSISSPAGKMYSNLHLGFMPVSKFSSFWLIALLLTMCLYVLYQSRKNQITHLFILGIACIQLTYFFGRSHEHNLLNISGIFIFILFLTLDRLYTHSYRNKNILNATIILIIGIGLNYSSDIDGKWHMALRKIRTLSFVEPDPHEKELAITGNYLKSFETDKIIILSEADGYINYRLGYQQIGYFSPFFANVFTDETVAFLKYQLNQGYRLIVYPVLYDKLAADILSFNNVNNKEQFVANPLPYKLSEITLVSVK